MELTRLNLLFLVEIDKNTTICSETAISSFTRRILGNGVELYNQANINKLKILRTVLMKRLPSGKFRFPELQKNYLSMQVYREMKIVSLNIQLNALNVSLLHAEFGNKDGSN